MRILDKYKDYYDYLQSFDDDFVFDRRGSYILTNQDICNLWESFHKNFDDKYLLLKIGYSYWLILLKCKSTAVSNSKVTHCVDYSLELIKFWKDYEHFDSLHFGEIDRDYSLEFYFQKHFDYRRKLIDDVKLGNYEYKKDFAESNSTKIIFNKTKIPSVVNAFDLYNAFEEYFSQKIKQGRFHLLRWNRNCS